MKATIPRDRVRRSGGRAFPLEVVILAACGETLIDVLGPYQIFTQASSEGATPFGNDLGRYVVRVLSSGEDRLMRSRGGLGLLCTDSLDSFEGAIDTLIVAGSNVTNGRPPARRVVDWIARRASSVRRLASVCSGAFVLAEAGLLNGRRATTHWRYAAELARRYPEVSVDPEPIYVHDGKIYTSAGMTSGMDLALALVEEDFGPDVALAVAQSMVLYLRRPGGQSQFSAALRRHAPRLSPVRRVEHWIGEHLGEPLPVEHLASVAAMSPRNFARVFTRETGMTPAKYVEELRLEEARRRLESGNDTVDAVAQESGFGSVDSLQRHFSIRLGVTPAEYRSRFRTAIRG